MADTASAEEPAADQGPLRILLVEDDPSVGRLATYVLQAAGAEVVCAQSGAEALALLADRSRSFDAIVIDRGLPDVSGDDIARHAASACPEVAVILATGTIDVALPPCDAWLEKPYLSGELVDTVSAAIVARSVRRQARRDHRRTTGSFALPG